MRQDESWIDKFAWSGTPSVGRRRPFTAAERALIGQWGRHVGSPDARHTLTSFDAFKVMVLTLRLEDEISEATATRLLDHAKTLLSARVAQVSEGPINRAVEAVLRRAYEKVQADAAR